MCTATDRWNGVSSRDRKSTRLNSSHSQISYAVFCLKKKKRPPPARPSILRWSSATLSHLPCGDSRYPDFTGHASHSPASYSSARLETPLHSSHCARSSLRRSDNQYSGTQPTAQSSRIAPWTSSNIAEGYLRLASSCTTYISFRQNFVTSPKSCFFFF